MSRAFQFGTVRGNGKYPDMDKTYRFRFVIDYYSGTSTPKLIIFRNGKSDSACGWSAKGIKGGRIPSYTLPHISWAMGYRFRKFGGLVAHRISGRVYRLIIGSYT